MPGQVVKIYDKALNFIKIRPHHSNELRKKLLMRGFGVSEVEEAIRKLQTQGLLNDDSYGEMYLESLIRYKTYGYYGLKAKLIQRGIASKDAEELLLRQLSTEDELGIARKLLEKSTKTGKEHFAQKLARKGFRSGVIGELLRLEF